VSAPGRRPAALARVRALVLGDPGDPDSMLVRREALQVGVRIALACAVAVVLLVGAVVAVVLHRVPLTDLLAGDREAHIALGAGDLIQVGVLLGVLAIVVSGVIGLVAARRALAPMAAALARQRRFVADASHELRTPATVLDVRVQLLQRSIPPEDPRRELVDALRRDSRRLGDVISDMLASVDQELRGRDEEDADAVATVRGVCGDLRSVAEDRGVDIRCEAPPAPVPVPMGTVRLARVLTALVDNAIKQSAPGTAIEVDVRQAPREVLISVRDRGPGIRGIDVDRVFDRFARSSDAVDGGGDARSGFGIGLSLVREAVVRAGGRVRVASTGPDGTTFEIALPQASAHPTPTGQGPR